MHAMRLSGLSAVSILLLYFAVDAVAAPVAPQEIPTATQAISADKPERLVEEEFDFWSVGGRFIYWADGCRLSGPDRALSDNPAQQSAPAATDDHYTLRRLPIGRGTAATLLSINHSSCETFRFLTADDSGVYYYNQSLQRLEMFPAGVQPGTEPTILLSNVSSVEAGLYLDDTHLYYATAADEIRRVAKVGRVGELVHTTGFNVESIALGGGNLYWIDSSGLWWGSKRCDSPPCAKDKLNGATGDHIVLGAEGLAGQPQTVYMVKPGEAQTIRSYTCSIIADGPNTCGSTLHYTGPSFSDLGPPVWVQTGSFFNPKRWLVWSERVGEEGRIRQKELEGASAVDRYSGPATLNTPIAIGGGQIYFADSATGDEKIMRIPLIGEPVERDVAYAAMEVTQAIQSLDHDVPLIAEKPTYVRVYGRKVSGLTPGGVEAELHGSWNGQALRGSPLSPIKNLTQRLSTDDAPDRTDEEVGWLFRLPTEWTVASVELGLRAVVDPRRLYNETDRSNNFSDPLFVTFRRKWQLCNVFVPVWAGTSTGSPAPLPSMIDNPHGLPLIRLSENLLPVPRVVAYQRNFTLERLDSTYIQPAPGELFGHFESEFTFYEMNESSHRRNVLRRLGRMARSSDQPAGCGDEANTLYIGMVHASANTSNDMGTVTGSAFLNSDAAWIKMPNRSATPEWFDINYPDAGVTLAHEEGHSYGRAHVACPATGLSPEGAEFYPYDPCRLDDQVPPATGAHIGFHSRLRRPIAADTQADMMSYGSTLWVSDFTWKCIYFSLDPDQIDCPLDPDNRLQAASTGTIEQTDATVLISGELSPETLTGTLDFAYLFPNDGVSRATRQRWQRSAAAPLAELHSSQATDPGVHLRLLAEDGTVLSDRVVELGGEATQTETDTFQSFILNFPAPDGLVARIELLVDEQTVAELTPGLQSPTLTILQPTSNMQADSAVTVAWQASDPDNDLLLFALQYSADGGATWFTVADQLGSNGDDSLYRLSLDGLPGSATGMARIRVLASDGYHTAIATSQPFTTANHEPMAQIASPLKGEIIAAGQIVEMSGEALDVEDGLLMAEDLVWSLAGVTIANGAEHAIGGLAPGEYEVTFSAEDSNGQTGQASSRFSVAPLIVPDGGGLSQDGFCDDSGYADAAQVALAPYPDGGQPIAALVHRGDALWVCLNGLQRSGEEAVSQVSLLLDLDLSRDATVGVDDLLLSVREDGSALQQIANGDGEWVDGGPEGLAATVAAAGEGWQAEMRLPAAALGGWNRVVGLLLMYEAAVETVSWPHAADSGAPQSWAATVLGVRPHVERLDPNMIVVNSEEFVLAVIGSEFVEGTVVTWNGDARPTTYVDATRLEATISSADLTQGQQATVQVINPGLENALSEPKFFAVENGEPMLDSVAPDTIETGSESVELTLQGNNFVPGSALLWNGAMKEAVFVDSDELRVAVTANDLLVSGAVSIAAFNPGPGGGSSNALSFTLIAPDGASQHRIFMPFVADSR